MKISILQPCNLIDINTWEVARVTPGVMRQLERRTIREREFYVLQGTQTGGFLSWMKQLDEEGVIILHRELIDDVEMVLDRVEEPKGLTFDQGRYTALRELSKLLNQRAKKFDDWALKMLGNFEV